LEASLHAQVDQFQELDAKLTREFRGYNDLKIPMY
jgi:hypothetical protein